MNIRDSFYENPDLFIGIIIGAVCFVILLAWTLWKGEGKKIGNAAKWLIPSSIVGVIAMQFHIWIFPTPDLQVEWIGKAYQMAVYEQEKTDLISVDCIRVSLPCDERIDLAEPYTWPKGVMIYFTVASEGLSPNTADLMMMDLVSVSYSPTSTSYNPPEYYAFKSALPSTDQAVMIVAPANTDSALLDYIVVWYRTASGSVPYKGWADTGRSYLHKASNQKLYSLRITDIYGLKEIGKQQPLEFRISVWLAEPGTWRFKVRLEFEPDEVRPFYGLFSRQPEHIVLYSPEIEITNTGTDNIQAVVSGLDPRTEDKVKQEGYTGLQTLFNVPSVPSTVYVVSQPNIVLENDLFIYNIGTATLPMFPIMDPGIYPLALPGEQPIPFYFEPYVVPGGF